MTQDLPHPVARYFAADTPGAIADCFIDTAEVTDERRTHRGRDEIRRWREELAKVDFTLDILSVRHEADRTIVDCQVAGPFKGSPVELAHDFRLAGDRIASLSIT